MKKLIGLAAAALIVASATSAFAKDWTTIRIASEGAYAPFNSVSPDGKLVGFDIDIAMALCDKMKVECTLVKQDWDGMIPALLAKKFDAIVAQMSITEERKKKVDFTAKYANTPNKFIEKKGAALDVTDAGLAGKKIGVQRETIADRFVTENYKSAEIVRYGSLEEATLDISSERVDVVLADSAALSEGFLKTPGGAEFEFVGPDFNDPKWFGVGAGIAVRQEDTDLRDMLNKAIAEILADGTYKTIEAKYFDFDVYGKKS